MSSAIYPICGIALSKALMRILSCGTIEISRNTRNTRSKRASNTPWPPAGIKLPITIMVSKTFQPFLKKPFLSSQAAKRILSSITKNTVIAISSIAIKPTKLSGKLCVLAPISNAETIMTVMTMA